MNIPRQSDLDNPDFLMKELMMDYAQDWIDLCAAAIAQGHFLAPEPARMQ